MNFEPCIVMDELSEGKSTVHVAVHFASESIVSVLNDLDLHQILSKMQQLFILEVTEVLELTHIVKTSGNIKCIEMLNWFLQKKTDKKLQRFAGILSQLGPQACALGNHIEALLKQCVELSQKCDEPSVQNVHLTPRDDSSQGKLHATISARQ